MPMLTPSWKRYVCEGMKLRPALISTQILQRDRHAELMTTLAIMPLV
jgi:adenylosuccinate lyase